MKMWNLPLWFLMAFFVCKICFDTAVRISAKHTTGWLLWAFATAAFLVGLLLAYVKNRFAFFFPFRLDIGLVMVPFMTIGYSAKSLLEMLQSASTGKKLLLAMVCLANSSVSVSSSQYGNPFLFLLHSLGGSGFFLCLGEVLESCSLPQRTLSWLGRHSLPIMCTHILVLSVVTKGLLILSADLPISNPLFYTLDLFLTLAGVVFLCKLLDI